MTSEPTVTRDEDGTLTLSWPDGLFSTPVAREVIEQWINTHNAAVGLRRALVDLLSYVEADHHITIPQHDHDCYELWKIEQQYCRRLIEDWQP